MRRIVKVVVSLVVAVVVLFGVLFTVTVSRPSAIGELTYDAARRQVSGTGRFVVASVSQKGCLPCETMKAVTWRDPGVVEWVNAHGVGVNIDLDRDAAIAKEIDVYNAPAIIVLADGHEIARHEGYLSAGKTLAWLETSVVAVKP